MSAELVPRLPGYKGALKLSAWAKTAAEGREVIEEAGNVLLGKAIETLNHTIRGMQAEKTSAEFDESTGLRVEAMELVFLVS